jgi:hypothetical protein
VLADLEAGRIADMDRHGITMQVLSSLSTQQVSADVAADLVRSANNTLAARLFRPRPYRPPPRRPDGDPRCRRHHRAKQAPGWHLQQREPGVMRWTVPSGRTHTTTPTVYDT